MILFSKPMWKLGHFGERRNNLDEKCHSNCWHDMINDHQGGDQTCSKCQLAKRKGTMESRLGKLCAIPICY